MEGIDGAYERFRLLLAEVKAYQGTVITESDTRLKVVDRVLIEVLGWPRLEILTEDPSAAGFVDYNLTIGGRSRLIVEAKRDGRGLGIGNRLPGRGFKLSGPVFSELAARQGIGQAIRYCGAKNAELACVTNGHEWIVFRGNRLGDGRDTTDGMAFVFGSLRIVETNFRLFYDLLSYESARDFQFRSHFQEAEGQPIRSSAFRRQLKPPGTAKYIEKSALSADLDRVMTSFFHRLTGDDDPDLLTACFVETDESRHADQQLARVSEQVVRRIKDLHTAEGEQLSELIARAAESQRHEFVIIVGTKGAGKSTFITRFFRSVLKEELARECVVSRVNLADSPGDASTVVPWLDQVLLEGMEQALFEGQYPEFRELEGMFFDEYTRLKKGPWSRLYETNHTEFQIRFGDWVESQRKDHPHLYIEGLIRHIVRNRAKLPVIVFDNADHFDISFQEHVYQYARALYERGLCLIILPITDRTSWQLSRHGALQSFEHEALFLPTPSTEAIIRKRIAFLQDRVANGNGRASHEYFVKRNITLSVRDLEAFTRSLQKIFLQTAIVSTWIGSLANHDVRRALHLARNLVTSPHLRVEDLLKAYLTGSAISLPQSRAAMALIRGNYDTYPLNQHEFVQNVFWMSDDVHTSPLLGVRLLQVLADAPAQPSDGAFLTVDQVIDYCQAMGLESRVLYSWLDALLKAGLCLNYDPTILDISDATRLEISPAGRQHLTWSRASNEYVSAMADVTPIFEEAAYESIVGEIQTGRGWRGKTAAFINYLVVEDGRYCVIPEHSAYSGQVELRRSFEFLSRRLAPAQLEIPDTAQTEAS